MYNSGIYLNFYGCYGNKIGRQNRLKIEKSPFWTKFKALGDRFLRFRYQLAKYQKTFEYVVCCANSHHLLKYLLVFARSLC